MRGTLHVVPAADARWMLELMASRIVAGSAGRHRRLELDAAAFRRSRALLDRALTRESILSRGALYAELERGGVSTAGQRGIHILRHLAMERMLCHGPHDEKLPTFALFDDWIATSNQPGRDEALQTIAERYFRGHGPATLRDFVWWTGLTVKDAKAGLHLAQPSLARIVAGDGELWMSNEHMEVDPGAPRAHLLPGFDEYMLGYKDRSASLAPRYAGNVAPGGNGVFCPTLVLDGQVVGTWRRTARAKSVDLEASPFAALKPAAKKTFVEPAERYAAFLGVPVGVAWH
jgi:hypothetical protein